MKKIVGAVWKLPYPAHFIHIGLDWLCYLEENFQMAPTIFFTFSGSLFLNDFIKNPQTRNARPFLPLNISAVGSVITEQTVLIQSVYVKWISLGSLYLSATLTVLRVAIIGNILTTFQWY